MRRFPLKKYGTEDSGKKDGGLFLHLFLDARGYMWNMAVLQHAPRAAGREKNHACPIGKCVPDPV